MSTTCESKAKNKTVRKALSPADRMIWFHAFFWGLAMALALLAACDKLHYMQFGNGISNLDIKDALLRGDINGVINLFWSPLYPALLALGFALFNPSPYWEFAAVKAVNLMIFFGCLHCFSFLLHEIKVFMSTQAEKPAVGKKSQLPEPLWMACAYLLFILATVYWIHPNAPTGDMLVAAMVFLMAGLIMRIQTKGPNHRLYGVLGLVWGTAYLAKAAMLIIGAFFMISALLAGRRHKGNFRRFVLAVSIFLVVAGPWMLLLSIDSGRLTTGEAGRFVYYRTVVGSADSENWQAFRRDEKGEPFNHWKVLSERPLVYHIGREHDGVYPPWLRPTEWFYNPPFQFSMTRQWEVLKRSFKDYASIESPNQFALFSAFALLVFLLSGRAGGLRIRGEFGYILLPSFAGIGLFALVWITPRYVAPFFALVWLALFLSVRIPDSRRAQFSCAAIMAFVLLILISPILDTTVKRVYELIKQDHWGELHVQTKVVDYLNEIGVNENDPIAVAEDLRGLYYARLGRFKIVAELGMSDRKIFWEIDSDLHERALSAFAKSGAEVIVARNKKADQFNGWSEVSGTKWSVFDLRQMKRPG